HDESEDFGVPAQGRVAVPDRHGDAEQLGDPSASAGRGELEVHPGPETDRVPGDDLVAGPWRRRPRIGPEDAYRFRADGRPNGERVPRWGRRRAVGDEPTDPFEFGEELPEVPGLGRLLGIVLRPAGYAEVQPLRLRAGASRVLGHRRPAGAGAFVNC